MATRKQILGLDIRFSEVTALLVGRGIKGEWIEDCVRVPITDEQNSEESLRIAVEEVTRRMDVSGAQCIASVSAAQVSFRTIRMPFKDPKKIRQVLPFELEPILSMPVGDTMIDFRPVKFSNSGDGTDLITASIEKSTLAFHVDTLRALEIAPDIITVSGYALAEYLAQRTFGPESYLVADIDDRTCTLFFISNRNLCFVRSFRIMATDSAGVAPLCAQIHHTITAFEDLFNFDFKPVRLVITGNGTASDGIDAAMENGLGFPVAASNLSTNAMVKTGRDHTTDYRPAQVDNAYALTLVETLGLKVLNFSKGLFASPNKWIEHKKSLVTSGILLGLVGLLFLLNLFIETSTLEKKVSRLENQTINLFTETFPDVKKIVNPVHQMQIKIDEAKKNGFINGEPEVKIRKIDILYEISKRIPKEIDVELTKLVMGSEGVLITGYTDTFNSVDEMKNRLEETRFFQKVTISSANINRSSSRVVFKLRAQI
jgi:general secretion pathway protein L